MCLTFINNQLFLLFIIVFFGRNNQGGGGNYSNIEQLFPYTWGYWAIKRVLWLNRHRQIVSAILFFTFLLS